MPVSDTDVIESFRQVYGELVDDSPLPRDWEDIAMLTLTPPPQRRRRRLIPAVAAVAVVVIVVGATAMFAGTRNPVTQDHASTTPASVAPTAPTPVPTTAPRTTAELVRLFPESVTVSSQLQGFWGEHLIDGDLATAWNDASLAGAGAWMTFTFDSPAVVEQIVIHNLQDPARMLRNHRIRTLEFEFTGPSGGSDLASIEVQDGDARYDLRLEQPLRGELLTVRVTATYPAEAVDNLPPFDELAIAEIEFHGYWTDLDGNRITRAEPNTPVPAPSSANASSSPALDVAEQPFMWDVYIENAMSGDKPVELRGQLLNVHEEVTYGLGALPLEYSSDIYPSGVHEAATFLLNRDSNILVSVQWGEVPGTLDRDALGFPQNAMDEQWGPDRVFINIETEKGEFAAVSNNLVKVVRFTALDTALPGWGPQSFTITETEMREIATDVFEIIEH